MSRVTWREFYKRQELLTLCEHLSSPAVFGEVRVAHLFSFLCCVFCFVCLRPVSCVPKVSGFSILDRPFGFLSRLFELSNRKQHYFLKIIFRGFRFKHLGKFHQNRYYCLQFRITCSPDFVGFVLLDS